VTTVADSGVVASLERAPHRPVVRTSRAAAKAQARRRLIGRTLLLVDVAALSGSFLAAILLVGSHGAGTQSTRDLVIFVAVLPVWVLVARLLDLHELDPDWLDYSTVRDLAGTFQSATIGVWVFVLAGFVSGYAEPDLRLAATLWALAIVVVPAARAFARVALRRNRLHQQNTLIVGAGDVGQLVARKLTRHPEYGLRLVGLVDDEPKRRRADLDRLAVVGGTKDLHRLLGSLEVERVIIAFSNASTEATLQVVHDLVDLDVEIDVVPRLFEVLGPNVLVHRIEGLPLTALPPARRSRSSALAKRAADAVLSAVALLLVSPLMAYFAWRIKRESPGPVFFRQTRLGLDMSEFTVLKFRTMKVDTDEAEHRRYIRQLADSDAPANADGIFKLDRDDAVTPFGRWLRKTSLDELPQLVNVLRGEMSLVGPRPCIPYEIETFKPQHFERFLVPAGLTGLWQVTARANSTFEEALDMDVAYVRGWSLRLDLLLLLSTPFQLLRQRRATA
jgi:exopolysaccharide biosynthesis polyprenyl glycosylphosphotransferase